MVPFLDSAIDSIRDGGLMCVTCTDTKVTCGPDISKCYYFYGTTRARVQHFNEVINLLLILECLKNRFKYNKLCSKSTLQIY